MRDGSSLLRLLLSRAYRVRPRPAPEILRREERIAINSEYTSNFHKHTLNLFMQWFPTNFFRVTCEFLKNDLFLLPILG